MATRAFLGQFDGLVIQIIDGDTVEADINMGLGVIARSRVRFFGINTPEINTVPGILAKQFLETILPVASIARFEVRERDKFGRLLAEIFFSNQNINRRMLDSGHANVFLLGDEQLALEPLSPLTPPVTAPQFPTFQTAARVFIGGPLV